jgi:hypothetical protein
MCAARMFVKVAIVAARITLSVRRCVITLISSLCSIANCTPAVS